METYNHLGHKGKQRWAQGPEAGGLTLNELLQTSSDDSGPSFRELNLAYLNSLKACLKQDQLVNLLHLLRELEQCLEVFEEKATSLMSLHQALSTNLLRVLTESLEFNDQHTAWQERCLEAVRLALEEEYYETLHQLGESEGFN